MARRCSRDNFEAKQWTILKHDPFLWCMHDGRIVDPRRVCPHSMHIFFKQAARAWQWRRVALHEGYEGLARPLFAALHSTLDQAHLRSVVVDGQRTQLHQFRAARSLSPLSAICGSEEGSLTHRHVRCSEGA